MPEFLTTRNITGRIENIIAEAKERLVLVSPYLSYIQDDLIGRIKDALARGVETVLIFRKMSAIHPNELRKLEGLPELKVLANEDLHAKAYFNEREGVVTSYNLSGYSEDNNIEFGIFFSKDECLAMYSRLVSETEIIIKESIPVSLEKTHETIRMVNILERDNKTESVFLSLKEKREKIVSLLNGSCESLNIGWQDEERLRIESLGITLYTNAERVDVIFDRPHQYQVFKIELEREFSNRHRHIKAWFNSTRINIAVNLSTEIADVYQTIVYLITRYKLVEDPVTDPPTT